MTLSARRRFASLAERVEQLRLGRNWSKDLERLAAAARTLHLQAAKQPLHLVAEGELPTLLHCALSGHGAIIQMAMSALATVAEAGMRCAAAIATQRKLPDVLTAMGGEVSAAAARNTARLLAAMTQDASMANEVRARAGGGEDREGTGGRAGEAPTLQ